VAAIDLRQLPSAAPWLTLLYRTGLVREAVMFLDNVVIAGVVTVGLMVLFFAGLGLFIWKDSHKRK